MEVLLPELLEAILSFIPVRPRLRAASLVCKRWRTLALRTVKEMPCVGPRGSLEHFPFTSLTELDDGIFYERDGDLQCPANLRHLYFNKKESLRRLHGIPRLESLSLQIYIGDDECREIVDLFRNSRDTLQSLTVAFSWESKRTSSLLEQHFPSLCALVLTGKTCPVLCENHASQLTSLHMYAQYDNSSPTWDFMRGILFPALTQLMLPAKPLVNNISVLSQCPKLRSIRLLPASPADLVILCPLIASLEVALNVENGDLGLLASALVSLQRLVSFSTQQSPAVELLPALRRHAHSSLTALSLASSVSVADIAPLTRLQWLCVAHVSEYNAVSHSVQTLRGVTGLTGLCQSFPRLRSLSVTANYPDGVDSRRAMASQLRALEEHGVDTIELTLVLQTPSNNRKRVVEYLRAACKSASLMVTVCNESGEDEEIPPTSSATNDTNGCNTCNDW